MTEVLLSVFSVLLSAVKSFVVVLEGSQGLQLTLSHHTQL